MKQGDLLYLGKAKSVYLTGKPDELLVVFRDGITAFDGQKKNVLAGKKAGTMQRLRHTSIRFLKRLVSRRIFLRLLLPTRIWFAGFP